MRPCSFVMPTIISQIDCFKLLVGGAVVPKALFFFKSCLLSFVHLAPQSDFFDDMENMWFVALTARV